MSLLFWDLSLSRDGFANFLWKRAAVRRSLTAVSTAADLYCVSESEEDMSVCRWMPSPIITPQSRKHMKRIFGHSFHSVTTFLKRQRAAGRRGGRSLPLLLFVPERKPAERKTALITLFKSAHCVTKYNRRLQPKLHFISYNNDNVIYNNHHHHNNIVLNSCLLS